MLTKLTSYFLTDGTPCSPRLLIHPVDANGAPLDALNDVSHATFRSRSRQLIREPLGYVKTKIRQAARDPRALKWEQQLSGGEAQRLPRYLPTMPFGEGGASADKCIIYIYIYIFIFICICVRLYMYM